MADQQQFRPQKTGNPVIDEGFRQIYDYVYSLNAGNNNNATTPAAPVSAPVAAPSANGISVTQTVLVSPLTTGTLTLHYKDWSGANQSADVVILVTPHYGNQTFVNGIRTA